MPRSHCGRSGEPPTGRPRGLGIGAVADLTITRWTPPELADDASAAEIRATVVGGRVIHEG
ncbi:hypothetical protein QSJ19_12800 [Gordonia sp. ABSL11-1]|uniref:hypothetical protein n=1 Tax=Gordonia sp. ABSL11-1 TaxID=3053924 RepID=UPI0025731773|nr:hypothetical protein [Gordonia sp. ABSL11-1]MDL9946456.1 hypothetical protein [Gordonia sp. ABSL11-1]